MSKKSVAKEIVASTVTVSKTNEKMELIEFNGISIRQNSIYKITNKPDANAPSGFVQEGASKLPSKGIGNTVHCRFVPSPDGNSGLYDTGFYEGSPCYANKDKTEVREIVKKLRTYIVEPYEKKYGEGVLDHKNLEFWDNTGIHLYEGRVFSTDNVDDLLALYVAILSYELAPKNKIGDSSFRQAQYCIEDIDQIRSIKEERNNNKMEVIFNFSSILRTNRAGLFNLLKYVGLNIREDANDSTINGLFMTWLDEDSDNIGRFQKALDIYNDDKTSEIIDIYGALDRVYRKKKITRARGYLIYKGVEIGTDLKSSAKNLFENPDLEEIKEDLFTSND